MRICRTCNWTTERDALYCANCGATLGGPSMRLPKSGVRVAVLLFVALLLVAILLAMILAGCERLSLFRRQTVAAPAGTVRLAGVSDSADSVLYLIDTTAQANKGSTAHQYMVAEAVRSLSALKPTQRFGVVLFGAASPKCFAPDDEWLLRPATPANIGEAKRFILAHVESGTVDEGACGRALDAAFRYKDGPPDVVFLVATRAWTAPGLPERIDALNRSTRGAGRARINTIGFVNPQLKPLFQRIAAENGGQFRFVDAVDLGSELK